MNCRIEPATQIPLSSAQERLWYLQQLHPASPAYNVPLVYQLNGLLDVCALEASLNALVVRHETLRTVFTNEPLTQVVLPARHCPLRIIDLSSCRTSDRDRTRQQTIDREARRLFDLSRDAPFRWLLIRLGAAQHLLMLTLHHIAFDGWSLGVLHRELSVLYAAHRMRTVASLKPLPIQYVDYSLWHRELLASHRLDGQLEYWKRQLAGELPVLRLPSRRKRSSVDQPRCETQWKLLPRLLIDKMKALGKSERASLFMTLMATFKTLLYRYSGQTDITVGMPVANRTWSESKQLIGFFVNTLPLRSDLSGNPTYRELLVQVRANALDGMTNEDLPFDQLVAELRLKRELDNTPLFQTLFVFQNVPQHQLTLSGLSVEAAGFANTHAAKFDLTVSLHEEPAGIVGRWEYRADLFDDSTIQRMQDHFAMLAAAGVANPDCPISSLPMLTSSDRSQILHRWNDTAVEPGQDQCVHHLFEKVVETSPDSIAIVSDVHHVSYGKLNELADRLASKLRASRVGPEVRVGILLERSLESVVAILAIMKAEGGYVPLDPQLPAERLAQLCGEPLIDIEIVLTQGTFVECLPTDGLKILNMDQLLQFGPPQEHQVANRCRPRNLLYILFTSGSSGTPKGVAIEHAQLANYLLALKRWLNPPPGAHFAWFQSVSTDLGNTTLFGALVTGGCLHVISEDLAGSPAALADYLVKIGTDYIKICPSHLQTLQASVATNFLPHSALILGGEPVNPEWVSRLLQSTAAPARIINHYGPTETTIGVLTHEVNGEAARSSAVIPIGVPIANTQAYVADRELSPVPALVSGELFVGGANLARGYVNSSQQTAERFIPDPFSSLPGRRLYRTGDVARHTDDGKVVFIGRADRQIKVRGFRVDPSEVEACLESHPMVARAIVSTYEASSGDKLLSAYVVPVTEHGLAIDALQTFLEKHLPRHMVPSAIVRMGELPLNSNGKLDRRRLPAPPAQWEQPGTEPVDPRTAIEETLSGVWSELLAVARLGVTDNFFTVLGGHSLLATQLVSRIRDAFDVELSLRNVVECPTVAEQAELIEAMMIEQIIGQSPSGVTNRLRNMDADGSDSVALNCGAGKSMANHLTAKE